jgi:hypothetical protein
MVFSYQRTAGRIFSARGLVGVKLEHGRPGRMSTPGRPPFSVLARRERRARWKTTRTYASPRGDGPPQTFWRVAAVVLILAVVLVGISFLPWRTAVAPILPRASSCVWWVGRPSVASHMNWCGHGQEVIPVPLADGRVTFVPVLGETR